MQRSTPRIEKHVFATTSCFIDMLCACNIRMSGLFKLLATIGLFRTHFERCSVSNPDLR